MTSLDGKNVYMNVYTEQRLRTGKIIRSLCVSYKNRIQNTECVTNAREKQVAVTLFILQFYPPRLDVVFVVLVVVVYTQNSTAHQFLFISFYELPDVDGWNMEFFVTPKKNSHSLSFPLSLPFSILVLEQSSLIEKNCLCLHAGSCWFLV